MSRVVYSEDDVVPYEFQEQALKRAIEGRRGQAALRLLIRALDAMPGQRIIDDWLSKDGDVCTIGAMLVQHRVEQGKSREEAIEYVTGAQDVLTQRRDGWDWTDIADLATTNIDIARYLALELVSLTDEWGQGMTPEKRWAFIRTWATNNLKKEVAE